MDGLTTCCVNRFLLPFSYRRTPILTIPIPTGTLTSSNSNSRKLNCLVFASKDDEQPKLDHADQMELKFGRMIGEDPRLTLAKVLGRKANPDVSYLEIEKAFERKKKGDLDNQIVELPFGDDIEKPLSRKKQSTLANENVNIPFDEGSRKSNPLSGLNLVRPVPKKGMEFQVDKKLKKPPLPKEVADNSTTKPSTSPPVMLRKPTTFQEDDDIDFKRPSRGTKIRPNLVLNMSKDDKAQEDIIKLLRKPQAVVSTDEPEMSSGDSVGSGMSGEAESFNDLLQNSLSSMEKIDYNSLLQKPSRDSSSEVSEFEDDSTIRLQPLDKNDLEVSSSDAVVNQSFDDSEVSSNSFNPTSEISKVSSNDDLEVSSNSFNPTSEISKVGELKEKPKRLNQSTKPRSIPDRDEVTNVSDSVYNENADIGNFVAAAPLQGREDADWTRAEELLETEERDAVELISCSTRGFVASFGTLVGFLPYRNLGAKWKFLAFESWLRKKGVDPSKYKQNLGIIGVQSKNLALDSNPNPSVGRKFDGEVSEGMMLEDLLEIYEQEKIKFLQSFIGLKIKVNVVLADRNSRRLMFSPRPKEKEESLEKKRNLMAKLNVGDVVKCCIQKITYFGIFVKVEGVTALIHQSEVSWDATLDPSSSFKIGQIVEAKVHQLDFALGRIQLSLKETTPDPLIEALEFVVGDRKSFDERLGAAQANEEWAEVESLMKELQQIKGVQSVSKGRFFVSPGLAPTFQVYMAPMFEKQYKLLARFGNKVQEVMVQASLDKEQMKAVILTCTNKVQ